MPMTRPTRQQVAFALAAVLLLVAFFTTLSLTGKLPTANGASPTPTSAAWHTVLVAGGASAVADQQTTITLPADRALFAAHKVTPWQVLLQCRPTVVSPQVGSLPSTPAMATLAVQVYAGRALTTGALVVAANYSGPCTGSNVGPISVGASIPAGETSAIYTVVWSVSGGWLLVVQVE